MPYMPSEEKTEQVPRQSATKIFNSHHEKKGNHFDRIVLMDHCETRTNNRENNEEHCNDL